MFGAALIVGSGLYALHREVVRAHLDRTPGLTLLEAQVVGET